MSLISKTLTGPASRLGAAAQNALEVARFGGLATDEEPSPFEVVSEQRVYRLRHYHPEVGGGPPVLLVPPLMLAAEIYDVAPSTSGVSILREHGADPWVVDFGARSQITCSPSRTRSSRCATRPVLTSISAATRRAACSATRWRRSDVTRASRR